MYVTFWPKRQFSLRTTTSREEVPYYNALSRLAADEHLSIAALRQHLSMMTGELGDAARERLTRYYLDECQSLRPSRSSGNAGEKKRL